MIQRCIKNGAFVLRYRLRFFIFPSAWFHYITGVGVYFVKVPTSDLLFQVHFRMRRIGKGNAGLHQHLFFFFSSKLGKEIQVLSLFVPAVVW